MKKKNGCWENEREKNDFFSLINLNAASSKIYVCTTSIELQLRTRLQNNYLLYRLDTIHHTQSTQYFNFVISQTYGQR